MIGPIRKIILLITMRLHYTKPLRIHFKIKSEISVNAPNNNNLSRKKENMHEREQVNLNSFQQ